MAGLATDSGRWCGVRPWQLISALFIVMSLGACSAVELEPLFSGPIPVTREGKATEDWPVLNPAPTETPTAVQVSSEPDVTKAVSRPTAFPPPTDETIPAGTTNTSVTPSPAETISPTPTPWDVPYQGPTPTPVPPPPGLIYEDKTGLWLVADNWQPELLAQIERRPLLSPDTSKALVYEGDDIWLVDLSSNQRLNLTEGTGRGHCCAQWWPARPDTIILGSWPTHSDLGPTAGNLSAIDLADGSYQLLDEQVSSNAWPAPGPDGQRIAYDRGGAAWLYHWGEGPEALDLAAFGLGNIVRIGGPAWSPDGRKIAWTAAVAGQESDPWQIALAIVDLDRLSGRLLHPYITLGRGGWFDPPTWSPDGLRLAFVAEDANFDLNGLWVVAEDGSREDYLGPGTNPTWSPDNHWLAYTAYSAELDPAEEIRLAEVASWYSIKMDLPLGATIRGWLE